MRLADHVLPRLRGLTAAAVAIVALSACGGGSTRDSTTAAKGDAATSTTSPTTSSTVVTTTTMAASASTSTPRGTAARAARTTAAAPASAGSPAAATSAPATGWAPAASGVYRYSTTGSTSSMLGTKAFPSVTTLTVDPASGTGQHSVRALVSPNGDGFVIDQILDFQPGGVAVVRQRLALTQSGSETVRTLNAVAPSLAIPFGSGPGAHREFDLTGESISGHEVVDVIRAATATVGGQSVSALVVKTVLQVTGNVSGTIELEQWWAPSLRLPVQERLTATIKSGMVTVKTTYDASLQSVTPA